jgi:hypothetical protein
MNIFRMIEEVDAGTFLTLARHDDAGKVLTITIHPVISELVYPPLYMDDEALQPLVDKIEHLLTA